MAIEKITVEYDTDYISSEELENAIQNILEQSVISKLTSEKSTDNE